MFQTSFLEKKLNGIKIRANHVEPKTKKTVIMFKCSNRLKPVHPPR